MQAYYDTGVLVSFYICESFTEVISKYIENSGQAIPFSLFHRLELSNALYLNVFRGNLNEWQRGAVDQKIEDHIQMFRLVFRAVIWPDALLRARDIGKQTTATTGCRSLDLLHLAIAEQWGCSVFVSADARQLAAAGQMGLRTVDVRSLPA